MIAINALAKALDLVASHGELLAITDANAHKASAICPASLGLSTGIKPASALRISVSCCATIAASAGESAASA